MQSFTNIQATDTITNSRQELLNNDFTVMSQSAGTSFPTTNIQVGMPCLRTDLNQVYTLKDLTPTWILTCDLTKTYATQEWGNANLLKGTYGQAKVAVDSGEYDIIGTVAAANKWGFYVSSTAVGLNDWANSRNILSYTASSNTINIGGTGVTAQVNGNTILTSVSTVNAATLGGASTGTAAGNIPVLDGSAKIAIANQYIASASQRGTVIVGSGLSVDGTGLISVSSPFTYSSTGTFTGSTQTAYYIYGGLESSWWGSTTNLGSGSYLTAHVGYNYVVAGIGAGTYSLQTLLQGLVSLSHSHTTSQTNTYAVNCANCSGCDGGCFAEGTKVLMEDGTEKNIEDVVVGDRVAGLSGINEVIALKRPILGDKPFMKLSDDSLFVVASHNFWVKVDKEELFGNNDIAGYWIEQITCEDYFGLEKDEPVNIDCQEVEYATVDGWKLNKAEIIPYDPTTVTYQLVCDGSHTFIANGYVVGGDIRDDDFDYSNVKWEGLK